MSINRLHRASSWGLLSAAGRAPTRMKTGRSISDAGTAIRIPWSCSCLPSSSWEAGLKENENSRGIKKTMVARLLTRIQSIPGNRPEKKKESNKKAKNKPGPEPKTHHVIPIRQARADSLRGEEGGRGCAIGAQRTHAKCLAPPRASTSTTPRLIVGRRPPRARKRHW